VLAVGARSWITATGSDACEAERQRYFITGHRGVRRGIFYGHGTGWPWK
jgi:hypothetical protein